MTPGSRPAIVITTPQPLTQELSCSSPFSTQCMTTTSFVCPSGRCNVSELPFTIGTKVRLNPKSDKIGFPFYVIGEPATVINFNPFPNRPDLIGQIRMDNSEDIFWIREDSVDLLERKFGDFVTPKTLPEGSYIVIADETEDGFVHILSKTGEDYLVKAEDLL